MNTETIEEVKLDEKIERTVIDPGKYNVVFLHYLVTLVDEILLFITMELDK